VKILSNGIKATDPVEQLQMDIMHTRLKKPFNGQEVFECIGKHELKKVWIVGDRLMTDIYLGNQIGCSSLLVDPLEPSSISKHGLGVYILRKV